MRLRACVVSGAVPLALESRFEISLLRFEGGGGAGWQEGAGAVETVRVGELRLRSVRGSCLYDSRYDKSVRVESEGSGGGGI